MCKDTGAAFDFKKLDKLSKLHARVKNDPALKAYFASDAYAKYSVNNPQYANYNGSAFKGPFGPTTRDLVKITPPEPKAKGKGPAQQEKETPEQKAAKAA